MNQSKNDTETKDGFAYQLGKTLRRISKKRNNKAMIIIVVGGCLFCCILAIILILLFKNQQFNQNIQPSHYGVFIRHNGGLVELAEREIFDIPTEDDVEDAIMISDVKPIIVLWQENTNIDYLVFYKLGQYLKQQKEIKYIATPKEDGIIEVQPLSQLDKGVYCLVQGDPLAAFLPGWCFELDPVSISSAGESFFEVIGPNNVQFIQPLELTKKGFLGIESKQDTFFSTNSVDCYGWNVERNELIVYAMPYLQVYDLNTLTLVKESKDFLWCEALSPNGKMLVFTSNDTVKVQDTETTEIIYELSVKERPFQTPMNLFFSKDSQYLLLSYPGVILDLGSRTTKQLDSNIVKDCLINVSSDLKYSYGRGHICNLETQTMVKLERNSPGTLMGEVIFSEDGRMLFAFYPSTTNDEDYFTTYDTESGELLNETPLGEEAIKFFVGSLASNQTLVMNQDIVVDIGTGKVLYKDLLSGNPGKNLSFSPDGKFLLTQRVLYGIKR